MWIGRALKTEELMQGRVQQTDCHWKAVHNLEELGDVFALHRQELVQGRLSLRLIRGQDHLPHGLSQHSTSLQAASAARRNWQPRCHDPAPLEEHVLRAHQANPFAPELLGLVFDSRCREQQGTAAKVPMGL